MNIRLSRNAVSTLALAGITLTAFAASTADAQQRRHYGPQPEPEPQPAEQLQREQVYDDDPPLDSQQRRWRAYTRNWGPQRFYLRDADTRFGYNSPYYGDYGGFYDPYAYGYGSNADAYLQGRHDERQFQDWKAANDVGYAAYMSAMEDGLDAFARADYPAAAAAFLRAAKQNQATRRPGCTPRTHSSPSAITMTRFWHCGARSSFSRGWSICPSIFQRNTPIGGISTPTSSTWPKPPAPIPITPASGCFSASTNSSPIKAPRLQSPSSDPRNSPPMIP